MPLCSFEATRVRYASASLNGARYSCEDVVRVGCDESDHTRHESQCGSQHQRVLGDVLAVILLPQRTKRDEHT